MPNDDRFAIRRDECALIVVDMQNDFVREGAPLEVPQARAIIPTLQKLIGFFRKSGLPIVFLRFVAGPSETIMWKWTPACGPEVRMCWKGVERDYKDSPSAEMAVEVISELAPEEGEIVIDKYGYGGFDNSPLEDVLRARGVSQIVVGGTTTEICVEGTVRGGLQRGFEVLVIRDGVATQNEEQQEPALKRFAAKFSRVEDAATAIRLLSSVDTTSDSGT